MTYSTLPPGLVPAGASRTFDESSIPEALQHEHELAAGRWGLLHVTRGEVTFVDLADHTEHNIAAPGTVVIAPGAPHKVRLTGKLECRIDFYREP